MRRTTCCPPLLLVLCVVLILQACNDRTTQISSVSTQNHGVSAALLQGSNDWPMFGYNSAHTGHVDQSAHPRQAKGSIVWSRKFSPVFSSSVAGLGMLYVASTDGRLYALKQNTGTVRWSVKLGDYLTDTTPALQGQVLFVAVHSTALEALDIHTGQPYWTFETDEKIQSPPLVKNGRVLLASRTSLWMLDAASGSLLWKFHHGADGWPTTGSPTIAGNAVYVGLGSGTQLWALNLADGHVLWSFDTGDRIMSTAIVGNEMIYVATWHGTVVALNWHTGQRLWSYSLNTTHMRSMIDGIGGNMAFADGRLYVGDYRGEVLCIDALHGNLIWRYATGAQVLATPIVVTDHIYIGSGDGIFYALDTRTGRPVWHYTTGEIRASACWANNHLYIGSLSGMMYAFN